MNSEFINELERSAAWPAFGMGCAPIGSLYAPVSDAVAGDALQAAADGGIRYFDTAPYYGHGQSEARLGEFLRHATFEPLVSTKVGRSLVAGDPGDTGFVDAAPLQPVFDYCRDAVTTQIEASLTRLGRDAVDIALVHDIGEQTHGADHPARFREALDGAFPALAVLKAEGVVRAIGIGVNEVAVCLETLAEVELDYILLAGRYTLLEQDALEILLPLCSERGVRVIIGGPYNSGVLVGGDHYNYGTVPAQVARRVASLAATCAAFGVPLAAAALQFPLAHPAVVTVLPGLRSRAEVEATLKLAAYPIPAALWDALRDHGLLRADAPTPRPA